MRKAGHQLRSTDRLGEGGDLRKPELAAHDGGALDRQLFGRGQAVDPGGEEGMNGRWRRQLGELGLGRFGIGLRAPPLVDERDQLLGVQRIAARRFRQRRRQLVGGMRMAEQALDQLPGLLMGQRREREDGRVRHPATPVLAPLQELQAGQANDEDWELSRGFGDVLDQPEQGGIRPLEIVDQDHQRSPVGQQLEQVPDSPGGDLGCQVPLRLIAQELFDPPHAVPIDLGSLDQLIVGGRLGLWL